MKALGSLDILVNNAGIRHVTPIEAFPAEKWDAVRERISPEEAKNLLLRGGTAVVRVRHGVPRRPFKCEASRSTSTADGPLSEAAWARARESGFP